MLNTFQRETSELMPIIHVFRGRLGVPIDLARFRSDTQRVCSWECSLMNVGGMQIKELTYISSSYAVQCPCLYKPTNCSYQDTFFLLSSFRFNLIRGA